MKQRARRRRRQRRHEAVFRWRGFRGELALRAFNRDIEGCFVADLTPTMFGSNYVILEAH
jgi:hypothetical protein